VTKLKLTVAATALAAWVAALGGVASCQPTSIEQDAGGVSTGASTGTFVRFVHLSLAVPALELCFARNGGALVGPVFRALLPVDRGSDAAPTGGIALGQASSYVELPPGTYDLRFVAAGSHDCAASLIDVSLPSLVPGAVMTMAITGAIGGVGDAAFTLRPVIDETTAPPTRAGLRFVHLAPGAPALDIGVGTPGSGDYRPLVQNLRFGETSAAPSIGTPIAIDALGYLEVAAVAYARITAQISGDGGVEIAEGANLVVGNGAAGSVYVVGGADALRFVGCLDAPSAGMLGPCALLAR